MTGPRATILALAALPLALLSACGKSPCGNGMELDSKRSQPGKVALCLARGEPGRAVWLQFYDNGNRRQVCPFLGGRPGGAYQAFYKSGQRWLEGRYLNGVKAGRWEQWGEDGQIVASGEYREGGLIQGAPVATPATCEAVSW